ncbi:MAG TPA: hypothetical protein VLJ15_02520 [Gammaproteobacteria bacterium]|nr:hypothetical protein [Gammaproteobacteria bacterium]
MRFKNCTLGFIKKIYLEKMSAMEKKDEATLEKLKTDYPELFDSKFLMDVLRNEFERAKKNLGDDMLFTFYLFQYH